MTRLTVPFFLLFASAASGFSPVAVVVPKTTTARTGLNMVAGNLNPKKNPLDSWSDKPIHDHSESTPLERKKNVSWIERRTMSDVIIDPDYSLALGVALLCPLIIWYHPNFADEGPSLIGLAGGLFHLLFAALLWVQTRRVRCVFEKDGFEFYNIQGPGLDLNKGAKLTRKPDNYVAGTRNRWNYDSIINYGYFPSKEFPVICYFKETETPEWKWNRWFAAFDSYGRGQPHFFPGICNVQQFDAEMEKRGVARKPTFPSKTK